jgi:hypothetical protein
MTIASGNGPATFGLTGKPVYQTGEANYEPAPGKLVDCAKEHQATVVVDQLNSRRNLCVDRRCSPRTYATQPWRRR